MADNTKKVGVKFTNETSQTEFNPVVEQFEKINGNLENINEKIDTMNKKIKGASSFKVLATRVAALVKNVDKLTSYTDKYITSQNVLNQTFGNSADEVNDYIKNLSRMTGISTADLSSKTALFGQMATSLGMGSEMASQFAIQLDDLSAKMAILYGTGFTDMSKAVLDAIKGESSTLTTLTGNVLKGTGALQATLDDLGIKANASAYTGVNKAMLQYITLARQVKISSQDVNGQLSDLTKVVNDVAWQKQILKNQVRELAQAFGNLLYPILRAILPVINGILIAITAIINTLARLFGYTEKTSISINSGKQAWDDYGDSIDGASKKAKKSLRGFDKLNNITTPTATTSSLGGGIDKRLLNEFNKLSQDMIKIRGKAEEISEEILKWLGFTKDEEGELKWNFSTIIDQIKNKWKDLGKALLIGGGIGLAILGIVKLVKWLKNLGGESKTVAKFGNKAGDALKIMAIGLAGLAVLTGLAAVVQSIKELVEVVSKSGMSTWEVLGLIGGVLLEVVAAIALLIIMVKTLKITDIVALVGVLVGLTAVLLSISLLIKTITDSGLSLGEVLGMLGGLLAEVAAFAAILVGLAFILGSNPLALIGIILLTGSLVALLLTMAATLPIILTAVAYFIEKTAPSFNMILETIFGHLENIVYIIGTTLVQVVNSIGGVFKTVFDGISQVVETVGDAISGVLDSIGNLVDKILKSILNFVDKAGPAINKFVDNIIAAVTKMINFIVSGIEWLINTLIIDSINGLIKRITGGAIGGAIADFLGVKDFKIGHIAIARFKPKLYASGGFPEDGLFFANHNELVGQFSNGKTAVANNEQIVKGIEQGVAIGMSKALSGSKFGNQPIYVKAQFGDEEITDWIQTKEHQRERQYGF